MAAGSDIAFDKRTSALAGASPREALAVAALRAAAWALKPLEYTGFSHVCRLIRPVAGGRHMAVRLSDDTLFRFPLGDGYWSLLASAGYRYERDVESFLRGVANVPFTFVDGGANFGYWSSQVTSQAFGRHPALAIEASSANFVQLAANAALNGNRFEAVHAAIGERGGERVALRGAKHETFSIDPAGSAPVVEEVTTLALDDLLDRHPVAEARQLVVKLDVEGMEAAAIRGGRLLLARDAVAICEEHGNDPGHAVSRFLMGEGYRLFFPDAGRFVELTDLDRQLGAYKTNPRWGYNVFATKSAFWIERLRAIVPPASSERN